MCLPICLKGHFAGMNLRGSIFAFESVQKEILKYISIYIFICIYVYTCFTFLLKIFLQRSNGTYIQVYMFEQIFVYISLHVFKYIYVCVNTH